MKLLIISTCKEKLHELEFVRPVEDIVSGKCDYIVKHYSQVKKRDLEVADKIIIGGTSLQDNKFIEDIEMFCWLKDFEKPVLGICAGMHVLGLVLGGDLKKKKEIGYYHESLVDDFLGLEKDCDEGSHEVWHLHNNYVDFDEKNWRIFMRSSDGGHVPEAVKHKDRELYGVLFHPEVRNEEIILNFVGL